MREWLTVVAELTIVVIDAMALVVIVVGTVEAFIAGMRMLLIGEPTGDKRREVWLRYARVLVAGLTFQLAADIIETSITVGWESVARLGAIAVIRTFLNFFLERDLTEIRERQHAGAGHRAEEPKGTER
jgi:uncharacterized membrane protein